ncbi:DEAD-box ATP-dependent RNA helicase, partial [Hypocenomyce scalaris]|nr:DEAD-box ATP-dependent RNA helicase [Hypocenomyce scalaris]
MADHLNMGGLSLGESQHANGIGGRSAYIPPHLRGVNGGPTGPPPGMDGAPPPIMNGGMNGSAWGGPPPSGDRNGFGAPRAGGSSDWANAPNFTPRGSGGPDAHSNSWGNDFSAPRQFDPNAYGKPGANSYGGSGAVSARGSGDGQWRDGKHIPGPANSRVERELFGVPNDPSKPHTGINFSNYDDIPVEASGHDVPEPTTQFTNPPLDDHLLSNIKLANYKTPTPVQKYSIPIVMGGRDLMACAQTGSGKTGGFLFPILSQ